MNHEVAFDVHQIIRALQLHHMQVTGPVSSGERILYHVNGHVLTEDELRDLSSKNQLSSWDIFNYAKIRSAKLAG